MYILVLLDVFCSFGYTIPVVLFAAMPASELEDGSVRNEQFSSISLGHICRTVMLVWRKGNIEKTVSV